MRTCVVCGSKFSSKMCPVCHKKENEKQILKVEQNYLPISDRINEFLTKDQQDQYKKNSDEMMNELNRINSIPILSEREKYKLKLKAAMIRINVMIKIKKN